MSEEAKSLRGYSLCEGSLCRDSEGLGEIEHEIVRERGWGRERDLGHRSGDGVGGLLWDGCWRLACQPRSSASRSAQEL